MLYDVLMPQLGMTMTEGSVVQWLKKPGELVEKGEFLFIIQTDKVDIEVESPCSGTLAEVLVELEQVVPVGTAIGRIAQAGSSVTPERPVKAAGTISAGVSERPVGSSTPLSVPITSASRDSVGRKLSNPRAKKLASELGLDISLVPDYEGRGRIVEADVRRFFEEYSSTGLKLSSSKTAAEAISGGTANNQTSSAARKAIAEKVTVSFQTVPPVPDQLNVVITDCPWEDNSVERRILEDSGAQVTRAQCTTPREVIEASKDADALLVGWAPITREVIGCLRRCRLLMRYGTGYDNIDLDAASHAGIAVAINAEYCLEEVATHAFALLLACHRQLGALQDSVRNGRWDPLEALIPFPPLSQQTVGVLGFGRIGRRFAAMVRPLVKQLLVHDPFVSEWTGDPSVQIVSFDRLLAESDYISIHVPLTANTHSLFRSETIARMKKGAYLINCARGTIVEEEALVASLRQNHLAGAALDVFSKEPLPADHPLRSFPRVIITPHAAWYSEQADHLLRANPAHNILRFFRGESISLVNNPATRGDNSLLRS